MRCQKCGAENQSGNFCMKCGNPLQYVYNAPVENKPPLSTLIMSLVAFCICFPLGLPATILMVHSRDAFYTGDMETFTKKNKSSRTCSIIGFILIGILVVVYLAFWILMIIGLSVATTY